MMTKIIRDNRDEFFSDLRSKKLSIAMCHGVFDLLHPGHIEHLAAAAKLADVLVVSVSSDEFVNKGPGRPAFDLETRMRSIEQLECVDYLIVSSSETAIPNLELIKPDYYVKGVEYADPSNDVSGNIRAEIECVQNLGGKIHYTDGFTDSSSRLINRFILNQSSELNNWLADLRKEYSFDDLKSYIDQVENVKVAILGEIIIDKYTFCTPLAKSSKHPILAFQELNTSTFPGGILAIADNVSEMVNQVTIFSHQSRVDSLDGNYSFKHNIKGEMFFEEDRPDIIKHRFVDYSTGARLFEKYIFDPRPLKSKEATRYMNDLKTRLESFDVVIVADYGHGFLTEDAIEVLTRLQRPNLCVNTQANAGNRGFNTIQKYPKASLICLNGQELQLELRDSNPDYFQVVPRYMQEKSAQYAILTLGSEGLLVFGDNRRVEKVPALSDKSVDRVGAGDAVLAIGSLYAAIGAPLKIIGLMASIAASFEISQLGHSKSLTKRDLLKSLKALLAS